MRKLSVYLVLIFLFQNAKAQIIAGKIKNYNPSAKAIIQIFKPINEIPQPWYSEPNDNIYINTDGSFYKKLNNAGEGMFIIRMPNGQDTKVYISTPSDSCFISLTDSADNFIINWFHGANAHGNYFLNASRSFIFNTILALSKPEPEFENFTKTVSKLHVSLIDSVDNFYNNKKINLKTKNFLINNIESEIVNSTYSILLKFLSLKITDQVVIKNILDTVFTSYYPLNPKYLTATQSAKLNSQYVVEFSDNGILKEPKIKITDSLWEVKDHAYGIVSRLPEPYREANLADLILVNLCYLKDTAAKEAIELFLQQYPNSPFNSVFLRAALNLITESKGTLSIKTEDSLYADKGIFFISDSLGLQHILNKYFQNKNVLIDCWATWCHYCIAEFPYYDNYNDFMKANNIEKLFVSFDKFPTTDAWQPMILNNNLKGYHILANKLLRDDISKIAKILNDKPLPLPRYILINKNGLVVSPDFIRPSSSDFTQKLKALL